MTHANDPLKPSAALLCKLGSIIVHSEELHSPLGHHFDKTELDARMNDPEVREWLAAMNKLAMLPVKRTIADVKARRK